MRPSALLAVPLLFAINGPSHAIDYGKTMAKKVKETLGAGSTKHFKFASYPVNNFGVATAYDSSGTELCATWTCLAEDSDVPTDADSLLSITTKSGKRYVDIGTGGEISFSNDEKQNIGFKVVLPQLLRVINLNLDIASNKDITTDLKLGAITVRKIIPDRVAARIKSLPPDAGEHIAFEQRTLQLVYSDIVAKSMTVTLNVDTSSNTDTDAKLSGALSGKVGSVIGGKDSELSLKVDGATKGKYVLTVSSPVILATWIKRQPKKAVLGTAAIDSWSDAETSPRKVFSVAP
jgi:hypothetical protein